MSVKSRFGVRHLKKKGFQNNMSTRKLALSDEILLSVEKPARYIGNEINMVKKDPAAVDVRFCMCFPDVYEI